MGNKNNRFLNPEMASKNRIQPPAKVNPSFLSQTCLNFSGTCQKQHKQFSFVEMEFSVLNPASFQVASRFDTLPIKYI